MSKDSFDSPTNEVNRTNNFSQTEVGITHPQKPGFIRICDNGNIEIFAGEEVGITLDAQSGNMILHANAIKFQAREIRWNKAAFNSNATSFHEPTFITIEDNVDIKGKYRGVGYFIDDVELTTGFKITDPTTGQAFTLGEYAARFHTKGTADSEAETT